MNKNFIYLFIGIVVIAAIALGAYVVLFQQHASPPAENNGESNEQNGIDDQQNSKGGLIICADKCGDSICQTEQPNCDGNALNCICVESPAECPQDCK